MYSANGDLETVHSAVEELQTTVSDLNTVTIPDLTEDVK